MIRFIKHLAFVFTVVFIATTTSFLSGCGKVPLNNFDRVRFSKDTLQTEWYAPGVYSDSILFTFENDPSLRVLIQAFVYNFPGYSGKYINFYNDGNNDVCFSFYTTFQNAQPAIRGLNFDELIDANNPNWSCLGANNTVWIWYQPPGGSIFYHFPLGENYLGYKYVRNGSTYVGWLRFNITNDYLNILEAYTNRQPGNTIRVGQRR